MNELDQLMPGILRIASIISIMLFAYIITFLLKLERTGCKCAMDWRRTYILWYCAYTVALAVMMIFNPSNPSISLALAPITMVLGLLFIVFTFQYVHKLKSIKCACSEDLARTIMYLIAIIDAAVFAVIGLQIIIFSVMAAMKHTKS